MAKFLHSVNIRYARYFNTKYKRVGPIFQSAYMARPINNVMDFFNCTRYIHRNPKACVKNLLNYPYSSLEYYLQTHDSTLSPWLNIENVKELYIGTFGGSAALFSQRYKQFFDTEDLENQKRAGEGSCNVEIYSKEM